MVDVQSEHGFKYDHGDYMYSFLLSPQRLRLINEQQYPVFPKSTTQIQEGVKSAITDMPVAPEPIGPDRLKRYLKFHNKMDIYLAPQKYAERKCEMGCLQCWLRKYLVFMNDFEIRMKQSRNFSHSIKLINYTHWLPRVVFNTMWYKQFVALGASYTFDNDMPFRSGPLQLVVAIRPTSKITPYLTQYLPRSLLSIVRSRASSSPAR